MPEVTTISLLTPAGVFHLGPTVSKCSGTIYGFPNNDKLTFLPYRQLVLQNTGSVQNVQLNHLPRATGRSRANARKIPPAD